MADSMINSTTPTPKKGVSGIGDTAEIHYKEWNMNVMNNPIAEGEPNPPKLYTKGQPK